MKMNEFAKKVLDAVQAELGEGFQTELRTVRKNNGVVLQGLMIRTESGNVIPMIYLEYFLAAYEDGIPLSKIVKKILEAYREEIPGKQLDMEFFKEFERVRDRICYRLIRRRGNEELLEKIPYVEFLDLAICFFYSYVGKELGKGRIPIYESHLDMWGVGIKELMSLAGKNTPRLYPGNLHSMEDILKECEDYEEGEFPADSKLEVLTNSDRVYGAACVLYPGMLEKIAGKRKKGFYIIPSSVHEVLILAETGSENIPEIRKIICEANRCVVSREEILSDNLYYYDYSTKTVRIAF